MTWYLAFDTSTPRSVIVLGRIAENRTEHTLVGSDADEDSGHQVSRNLLPRIDRVLTSAGVEPSQLAGIGCGEGPGTFTGTRVALATAKGLCFALGCPFYPIGTLTSVALGLQRPGRVLALLDARRDEVYGGLFECQPSQSQPPVVRLLDETRCCPIEQFMASDAAGSSEIGIIGPGVAPYRERLPEHLRETAVADAGVRAQGLWQAMVAAVIANAAADPATTDAVYLRKSYAELGINKPKRPVPPSPFV